MKQKTCILCAISLIVVVSLVACTGGTTSEELITPLLATATEIPQLIMPTTEGKTEAPVFSGTVTSISVTPLPEATTTPVVLLLEGTSTPIPTATNVFSIDSTLILYATQVMTDAPAAPTALTTGNIFEVTPQSIATSDTLVNFWALRMWPENLSPEQSVFDIFYGEVAKTEDISRYFFNFRPHVSPNGRYILLSGIGGYPHPSNDFGTGLWLFDLQEGIVQQLLPQAKIATWNPQSDQITYVEGDTVYTLSIDEGSTPLPLFSHPNLNWLYARWSPDGNWVSAITSEPGELTEQGVMETTDTYWIIPTNGEPAQKLAESNNLAMEHIAGEMAWSDDSQFLLIRNEVFNLAGEKMSPTYPGQAYWLPDQPLLLVNSDDGLHVVTVEGEGIADIGNSFASAWAFSHDGQQLAYAQSLNNGQVNIYTFNMETMEDLLIGSVATNFLDIIRWSSDDQYLLMDDGQNRSPIWAINTQLAGTTEQVLSRGVLIEVISFPNN
jgi:hypothetical protein